MFLTGLPFCKSPSKNLSFFPLQLPILDCPSSLKNLISLCQDCNRVAVSEHRLLRCFWEDQMKTYSIFKMFLKGLICGNDACHLKLFKNAGFTKCKNNLLKVWKGRGGLWRGGGLLDCSPPPSVQRAVCLRVPWSGSPYNWCAVCIAESWTAPFCVQGKM